MSIPLDDYRTEPRETTDGSIDLVSTSLRTADASPIVLNATDMIQTKFIPKIVDNPNDPQKSVSGKLVHEKKRKAGTEFPTERLTKRSVKVGDGEVNAIEIALDTSETYTLFEGIKALYELHGEIGVTPLGSGTFARVDSSFRQFQAIISSDPSAARMLGQSENFELVRMLLQIITQAESLDSLKNGLHELSEVNISALSDATNITKLEKALVLLDENMDNADEESWQTIFTDNQWILSQVFSCPYTIFEKKAYMGGKGLNNRHGNVCDFIYQNRLTQNIALIEIKTPCTDLFGRQYRGTYSLSADMSGAVNQVLNYKDNMTKEYYAICRNTDMPFELINPKCVVVIGKVGSLTVDQINTFENYRNSLSNVTVITFDELRMRVCDMIQLYSSIDSQKETEIYDYDDNELPL